MNKHGHSFYKLSLKALGTCFIAVLTLVLSTTVCFAHTPHDPIDVLVLSPDFGHSDQTLFIGIADHLLKSEDGGYQWKQLARGLDYGHLISSICMSPFYASDQTVFMSTSGDGVYRSQDGGNFWVKDNQGLPSHFIHAMFISPDGVLMAVDADGNLCHKALNENHWQPLETSGSQVTALGFNKDKTGRVVMFLGDREGNLLISSDQGIRFYKQYRFHDKGKITAIATTSIGPQGSVIFVGTEKNGIYKSIDGGASFVNVSSGITGKHIIDIAISEENSSRVFATTWHQAVFYSENGAATWQLFSENLTTDMQADTPKYRSPHFRRIGISKAFETDSTLFIAGFDGLFVSNTAGKQWKQVETLPVGLIKGMDVFASPVMTTVALTTYGGGAYLSSDLGNAWKVGNAGLKTTRLSDIRFSPVNHHRDNIVFSASMGYLLKSDDGGTSWKKTSLKYNGIRKRLAAFLNTLTAKLGIHFSWNDLLLKDLEGKKPWPTVIAVSRDFEKDKTLFFGTRYHGLYRSTDGGKTNKKLWNGTGRTIPSLVISPNFTEDKTLLASVRGMGVFKTEDAGNSWKNVSVGLDFVADWQHNKVVHQIKKKDIHLAISPDFKQDRSIYAASTNGLYKSQDGGDSWHKIQHPVFASGENIIGCGISPDYAIDHTLVISLKGRGLFQTCDGGKSFDRLSRELIQKNHDIEYIKFSPMFAEDRSIFTASDEALFVSADAGRHWRMLGRPVRYENQRRDVVRFSGQWRVKRGTQYSAGSTSVATTPGSRVELDFIGTGITWIGKLDSNASTRTKVYIDEAEQILAAPVEKKNIFSLEGLDPGAHNIRIEFDTVGEIQDVGIIAIDAFDILP